jgi:hypothetical protein
VPVGKIFSVVAFDISYTFIFHCTLQKLIGMSNPNYGVWRPMAENVEFNALESNSNAVMAVADTVRTTLGPKGLDKLLIDQAMNRHISNDGVTILLSLRAIHPVARMIVEIAERQEQLVGDGTTTAVVMAGNDKRGQKARKGTWSSPNESC